MNQDTLAIPEIALTHEDLWQTGAASRKLAEAAERLGPVLRWSIPGEGDYLFLVGAEANRFVLHTGREHFSHDKGWTPVLGAMFGQGLLNMDDPLHARHRKMWNPAFTATAMEAYLPILTKVVADRTATWPGQPSIDAYSESREITFDAAAVALAGFAAGPEVDRMRQLFYMMLNGPADGDWAAWEPTYGAAQLELMTTLLRMIGERRAAPATATPHDVMAQMVRARDDDGNALSDEQLLAHLNILLVAGHETTTTLSAWVLYLLATEHEQRALITAEVDALLDASDGTVTVEAIRGMKRLDLFIKEAGRLYSPVLNVPRGVVSDASFGGHTIPAGAQIRLALAATHRMGRYFAEPERFDPDRFAPPREEDRATPYSLVTFGGGSRICIGISFAQIEVKLLAAHVLRHYTLAAQPHRPIHTGHWTASIPNGVALTVQARN